MKTSSGRRVKIKGGEMNESSIPQHCNAVGKAWNHSYENIYMEIIVTRFSMNRELC